MYYIIRNTSHYIAQALVLDLQGEGVNFDNLWSGPGIPFGGSLIMMTLDIFLYACLAYYLDSVIPSTFFFHGDFCDHLKFHCKFQIISAYFIKRIQSQCSLSIKSNVKFDPLGEYGTKKPPWFCFVPGFWCQRKVQRVSANNNISDIYESPTKTCIT